MAWFRVMGVDSVEYHRATVLGRADDHAGQRLDIVNERRHQPLRTLTDRDRAQIAHEAIGPNGPLAKRKAFTRADVIRVIAPALYGCAAEELDRVVAGIVQHRECVPLVGQPGARGRA